MNKCHVLKELSSYLDNQLNDAQKQHVEQHLRDCRACAEELARLKVLSEGLKAWQAPELSADFDVRVRNKIVARELERGAVKMKNKTSKQPVQPQQRPMPGQMQFGGPRQIIPGRPLPPGVRPMPPRPLPPGARPGTPYPRQKELDDTLKKLKDMSGK